MSAGAAHDAVQAAFREEWGRIVATLIRRTGDWDLAEECAQEAFAEALRRWPADGVPDRPGAWLTTVAGNRAIDRLRRAARGTELVERIVQDQLRTEPTETELTMPEQPEQIEDDRLRLIFTCCHPALALEARVALTLRTLAGLTTAEIARAFLVAEPAMAKRLTRAKAKIANAGIPYRVPPARLLPERTAGVLAVLYLLFNEGYSASSGEELIRAGLCDEAIRLARLLRALMPDEPEATALLALMLLQHSRRDARLDATGELITLEDQDHGLWHQDEITEAERLLAAAGGGGRGWVGTNSSGAYRLQAEIAACHAQPHTDWGRARKLYELLAELVDSPVVRLNQAVAIAMSGDLDRGLALVSELAQRGELAGYHLLAATRADLLRRSGALTEATTEYQRALVLAPSDAERRFLTRRLAELSPR